MPKLSPAASKAGAGRGGWLAYLGVAGILLVVIALLGGLKFAQISMLIAMGEAMAESGPPPEAVGSARVEEREWEQRLRAVGSLVSDEGVTLTSEVAGLIRRIHFASGAKVRSGQVLVSLDTSVEQAQLTAIEARRTLAQQKATRSAGLVEGGGVSKQQAESDAALVSELAADAAALRAQIAKKVVRAPFAGKLGVRQVSEGQYLSPGTPIAKLESTNALFVEFDLPQRHLSVVHTGLKVSLRQPQATETLKATLSAIDPALDAKTRMVRVRASLPEAAETAALRPGMFFHVEVILGEANTVRVVPAIAVVHATYGDSVYTVEPGEEGKPATAKQRFVQLGEQRGDFVAIRKGLEAGSEVVVAGAFKLRNGAPIAVDNTVKAQPQDAPELENR